MTLDIQTVFDHVKTTLLENGEIPPFIVLEDHESITWIPPHAQSWNSKKIGVQTLGLFQLGRIFARETKVHPKDVEVVFLITETWFQEREDREKKRANRESIAVVELRAVPSSVEGKKPTLAEKTYMAEIIRVGGTMDLAPYNVGKEQTTLSALLYAFLSGVASSPFDDDELSKATKRFLSELGKIDEDEDEEE